MSMLPSSTSSCCRESRFPARGARDRSFRWGSRRSRSTSRSTARCPGLHPDTGRAGTVHIAEGIDALTRAMAEIVLREVPAEPFLVSGQYARPTRAGCRPARRSLGLHARAAACRARCRPRRADRRLGCGREPNAAFADRMTDQIEAVAPGFRSRVLARRITTPGGLEAANANLRRRRVERRDRSAPPGARVPPDPGAGRNETPVAGVYLASASAYPERGRPRRLRRERGGSALREHGPAARVAARVTAALSGSRSAAARRRGRRRSAHRAAGRPAARRTRPGQVHVPGRRQRRQQRPRPLGVPDRLLLVGERGGVPRPRSTSGSAG